MFWEVVCEFIKDAAVIVPCAAAATGIIVFGACQIDKNFRHKFKLINWFIRWLYSED